MKTNLNFVELSNFTAYLIMKVFWCDLFIYLFLFVYFIVNVIFVNADLYFDENSRDL